MKTLGRLWRAACCLSSIAVSAGALASSEPAGEAFEHRQAVDSSGRTISFFITHPPKPAPLVLVIGGSGCSSPVWFDGRDQSYVFARSLAGFREDQRLAVLVVEKPFAQFPYTLTPQEFGTEVDCSDDFRRSFTRDRWADQLRAALRAARSLPWVDSSRILVYGQSEGAWMATLLASRDPAISDVALVSGAGSGAIGIARDKALAPTDSESERQRKSEEIERLARQAERSGRAVDQWAFKTTYRYFASFARSFPPQEAIESRARFYIAHGWDDDNASLLTMEQTAVTLQVRGRDVVVRRLSGLDHYFCSLSPQGGREKCDENLRDEQKNIINWFLADR